MSTTLLAFNMTEFKSLASELCDVPAFERDAADVYRKAMGEVGQLASAEAPRMTGRLARNTGWRDLGDLQGELATDVRAVPYAAFVANGTHAYELSPVKAKALRIPLPGGAIFRAHASIPARDADPYLERTWARHGDQAVAGIEEELAAKLEKRI